MNSNMKRGMNLNENIIQTYCIQRYLETPTNKTLFGKNENPSHFFDDLKKNTCEIYKYNEKRK